LQRYSFSQPIIPNNIEIKSDKNSLYLFEDSPEDEAFLFLTTLGFFYRTRYAKSQDNPNHRNITYDLINDGPIIHEKLKIKTYNSRFKNYTSDQSLLEMFENHLRINKSV